MLPADKRVDEGERKLRTGMCFSKWDPVTTQSGILRFCIKRFNEDG